MCASQRNEVSRNPAIQRDQPHQQHQDHGHTDRQLGREVTERRLRRLIDQLLKKISEAHRTAFCNEDGIDR